MNMREMMNSTRKIKNKTFAMVAAKPSMAQKPKTPARIAIRRNASV